MAKNSPYKITVSLSNEKLWNSEVWYNGVIIKTEKFQRDFKLVTGETEYSGKKAVVKGYEETIKNYGFFEGGKFYPPFTEEAAAEEAPDFEKAQMELFNQTGEIGDKIPGLDKDKIIEELAKKEPTIKSIVVKIQESAGEDMELGMSEVESRDKAKKEIKKIIDEYKKNIKAFVDTRVTEINQQYSIFKKSIESIPSDVKGAIANIALPPAITAPPGAPNPVYALNLAKSTKNALLITLSSAILAFGIILKLCTELKIKLPDSIISLFDKISTFTKLLESIPV